MEIDIVDAFTDRPFAGNPAAVCILAQPADPAWMQSLAAEMNLSETAFLVPTGDAFGLRWFTPAKEVKLCGHATLAIAHTLWERGVLKSGQPALFDTLSGRLTARRDGEAIVLDFPSLPFTPCDPPRGLTEALGCPVESVHSNPLDVLVCTSSAQSVRTLRPDLQVIKAMSMRGVIVTARSDDDRFDFISRYFAPAYGVDEDPVTGSAHCCLAPFWAARLGRNELTGFQASPRGGVVRVRVRGDRVDLIGHAVTTLRGTIAKDARSIGAG